MTTSSRAIALTRRTALGTALTGSAVALATPSLALAGAPTPISRLWLEAETLRRQLASHHVAIAAKAQEGGIAGWMRLGGEANRIGEARYQRLMMILNSEPRTKGDLAILARVVLDEDIQQGAKGFAADRLAEAVLAQNPIA